MSQHCKMQDSVSCLPKSESESDTYFQKGKQGSDLVESSSWFGDACAPIVDNAITLQVYYLFICDTSSLLSYHRFNHS